MLAPNRLLSLALAGVVGLGLTACGGDEEPATPTTAQSPTTQAPTTEAEATTDAAAPATTEDEAAETAEMTTQDTAAGEVPELVDIWPTVLDNTENAEALDVVIDGATDGQEIAMHLRGQLDDSNYEATVEMDGAQVEVIMAEGSHYVRGDEGFWSQAGLPNPADLEGMWVQIPEEMGFADSFSISTLWEDFFASVPTDPADLQTSSAELTELDGQPAYHYEIETEDAEVWVAAEGDPYLMKAILDDGTDAEESMTIEISDYNDVDEVSAPEESTPIEEVIAGFSG